MPRLPPDLIRQANAISPHLALLLRPCRTLSSASAELRWITEHVLATTSTTTTTSSCTSSSPFSSVHARLSRLVRLRSTGVPLQYVLASQPFGNLDILCRRGVLIPRPETEAYVHHLAGVVRTRFARKKAHGAGLCILDLCSGSGCIALGLFALLARHFPTLHVQGIDVCPKAVALARENIRHNKDNLTGGGLAASQSISFRRMDVFSPRFLADIGAREWDVIMSNPPYVDPVTWALGRGGLGLSVRRFEPERALLAPLDVPLEKDGVVWERRDAFYGRLAEVVRVLQPEMTLWEVGEETQAGRVLEIVRKMGLGHWQAEVWRDWPDVPGDRGDNEAEMMFGTPTRGSGNMRSLFLQRE